MNTEIVTKEVDIESALNKQMRVNDQIQVSFKVFGIYSLPEPLKVKVIILNCLTIHKG